MAAVLQAYRRTQLPGKMVADLVVEVDVAHTTSDTAAAVQAVALTRARRRGDQIGKAVTVTNTTTATLAGVNRLTTVRMNVAG